MELAQCFEIGYLGVSFAVEGFLKYLAGWVQLVEAKEEEDEALGVAVAFVVAVVALTLGRVDIQTYTAHERAWGHFAVVDAAVNMVQTVDCKMQPHNLQEQPDLGECTALLEARRTKSGEEEEAFHIQQEEVQVWTAVDILGEVVDHDNPLVAEEVLGTHHQEWAQLVNIFEKEDIENQAEGDKTV